MLIWLQLLDKLVNLVVVLLFLLLLSLPLLSVVLTLSLADWTTVMPNCCTVIPSFIILSSLPLQRPGLCFLLPFRVG